MDNYITMQAEAERRRHEAHSSLGDYIMLKKHDLYHSIADDEPIQKYIFIKIGRWHLDC